MKYQESTSMYLPDDDDHFDEFIENGSYQQKHRDLALSYCQDLRIAIDIGAHVGFWTCDLELLFDFVHAFEPVPENFQCLSSNTRFATVHNTALGDGSLSVAHLRQVKPDNSGTWAKDRTGKHVVSMCTLDSYKFDTVDFIKIDVEGDELAVLRGAKDTIERCQPVICVELRDEKTMRSAGFPFHSSPEEVTKYLAKMGLVGVGVTCADYVFAPEGVI